ncbi:Rad52/Rad22 family DNA repair protein [Streptomyces sp. NPDC056194]|uniref:Rad52/Rad22 family DNA repair protein n=1 Tax=unclassified Streptomyces TaxID=2593676 RepID=UPI0035D8CB98
MTVTTLPTPLTGHLAAVPPAPTEQLAGPRDLTPEQVATLLAPINPSRVQTLNRQSHVEAWDVRRWLNRTFGFAGWSLETLELACVAQSEISKGRWTVVYRAQVRLTVKAPDGRALSSWEDAASGDAPNQKAIGDAHDMAMKTALSQALKRCAVNLGDQFGLSLYNDGSRRPVVQWTAVHTTPKDAAEDEPVKPEPAVEQRATEAPAAEQQPRSSDRAEPGPWEQAPAEQDETAPANGYVTKAKAAKTAADVRVLYDTAKAEGVAPAVLAEVANIGATKPGARPRRKDTTPTAPPTAPPPSSPPAAVDAEQAAVEAENALRLAASRAQLADLDEAFERVHGLPIEQAPAAQLDAFRAMIENGAGR